ncbi:MAG: hypothetical protein WCX65_08320 [bacterium]
MKSKLFLVVMFALLFGMSFATAPVFTNPAMAQDSWGDEAEEEDAFGNIMKTTFATIDKVDFTAPAANGTCDVKAKITFTDEDGESKITAVKIIYFVNGDYTKGNEASMSGGADGVFSGQIPAQAAGTKIDFIIRIEDSNGNVTSNTISSTTYQVNAISDMDNSADIVADNADIIGVSAGTDGTSLFVSYNVQGKIDGGTIDPAYIQLYGIKITNPDQEQGEGLMVGKLWVNLPLAKEKAVQEKFMPMILEAGAEVVKKIGKEKIDNVMVTGMLVLNIQKLMGGNFAEGLLFDAEPAGKADGGKFSGSIKLAALGDNPSGYVRVIVLTAANASLDSFMPIPLNCSHFLTLYKNSYGYTVK